MGKILTSPPDFDTLFEDLRVSEVGISSDGITWFPAEQGCSWEIDGKPVSKETEIGVADGEVASMGSGFGLRLELADLITSQQFDQTPVLTHYPDGRTAYRFELLGDQQPTVRGCDDSGALIAGKLTALLYFFT